MKIANAVLLMAAVGSANAQFLRTKESTLDCLQHCASVDGRKKLSSIKKKTFKTAVQCSESCTTNRSISVCAGNCYKKFAKDAQKVVDKAVKSCEKKCDDGDDKCKKDCDKKGSKNISNKDAKKAVSKIGGKVTGKVDKCLATCVHGSEGLDFMDYDYYDYPEDYDYSEDYDYYLEDPEDSEDLDYEDSMDLEDYEDFEDEDSEDFELIAGAGDEEGEGKGKKSKEKKSTKKEDKKEKKDEKDEKEPRKGSKEYCKVRKNKNSRHCDKYYERRNKHHGRKDDYCEDLDKNECEVAVEMDWCEWYDKHNKRKGCRAFMDDEDVFMAYA